MPTIDISIKIPLQMRPYIEDASSEETFERNAMILYPYIQRAEISHGRAAEILGIGKLDLIEYYNHLGLPYLNQSKDELLREVRDYRIYKGMREI